MAKQWDGTRPLSDKELLELLPGELDDEEGQSMESGSESEDLEEPFSASCSEYEQSSSSSDSDSEEFEKEPTIKKKESSTATETRRQVSNS